MKVIYDFLKEEGRKEEEKNRNISALSLIMPQNPPKNISIYILLSRIESHGYIRLQVRPRQEPFTISGW